MTSRTHNVDDGASSRHEGRLRAELDKALTTIQTQASEIAGLKADLDESRDDVSRWIFRIADIRTASGLGVRPMLDELPGEIAKLAAAASQVPPLQSALDEALEGLKELGDPNFNGEPGMSIYAAAQNEFGRRQRLASSLYDRLKGRTRDA